MNPCDKCLMPSKIKCCHNCKKDAAKCGNWHKCGEDCEKWEAPIQTNADRIRAMSDELLAKQLTQAFKEGVEVLGDYKIPDNLLNECEKSILIRLKQPAEVEG